MTNAITLLIGPAVIAAAVSAFFGIVTAYLNNRNARSMHEERLAAEVKLAEKKYHYERALADWKRRTELAERVLAGFYKARAVFKAARSPFARPWEGKTREGRENEPQDEVSTNDALYAPYERLNKEVTFITDLTALSYQFAAVFGIETVSPFYDLNALYNEVAFATSGLLARRGRLSDSLREKYEKVIWWDDEKDLIGERLDRAVEAIEKVCRPVLTSQPH